MKRYYIEKLDEIVPENCSCGTARRAFMCPDNAVASVHIVEISGDSRTHYHKHHTEIYLIIEGEGHLELDGELVAVTPMTSVMIKPGCRHRAIGKMKIINIPIPKYDQMDEWFDD